MPVSPVTEEPTPRGTDASSVTSGGTVEAGPVGAPTSGEKDDHRARLVDRSADQQALDELLDGVRGGMSRTLVLRGEPGIGKSTLLRYAVECAADLQVLHIAAVESETAMGFAAVHQLLLPLLPVADRLPAPQQAALLVAFGVIGGPPPDPGGAGRADVALGRSRGPAAALRGRRRAVAGR
jgi:hypothetical protein